MSLQSYYVSGSNIFNQWLDEVDVFSKFKIIKSRVKEPKFDIQQAKLKQINWWYNIFQYRGELYLTGNTKKRYHVKKINLPEECKKCPIVAGNDYSLIFGHTNSTTIWIMQLEDESIKQVHLTRELPVEESAKRPKPNDNLERIIVNNATCAYITQGNKIYIGMLPTYVDTSDVEGQIIDVVCGFEHYILLTDTGFVYTWGESRRLQLGHADVCPIQKPKKLNALAGIKIIKIRAGGWHSLALSEFGDLYVWGWNDVGQLGVKEYDNKLKSYSSPKIIDLFEDDTEVTLQIKDIGCGNKHSVILLEDGSIWTTGCNKYGQLALPFVPATNYFRKVCEIEMENNISLICGPWTTVIACDK